MTCGAVNALATIAAAVCLRTPRTGIRSSAAGTLVACPAAPACGTWPAAVVAASAARSTSSLVTRPSFARPAARQPAEVDAEVPGQAPHGRLRQGARPSLPGGRRPRRRGDAGGKLDADGEGRVGREGGEGGRGREGRRDLPLAAKPAQTAGIDGVAG